MNLAWTINRLRNMGPAEITHRLVEAARRRASRQRHEGWHRFPAQQLTTLPGLAEALATADAVTRGRIAEQAAALREGRFSALGRAWPRQGFAGYPETLWRLDPITGKAWPGADTYCFDIDFRHAEDMGDVKYVWEVNRLAMLQPLAAQVLLADDPQALADIEQAIHSWHAANPPFRGVAWASGIEVALRAINLAIVHAFAGPRLSTETLRLIGEILVASAFWLPRFPSRHSSANNHLVAELAGEYVLARLLGHESSQALRTIAAEIQKQLLPDGTPAEQTPTYGAFTAELALLVGLAGGAAAEPLPRPALDRLGLFAGFINTLGAPTPRYGDDDEGRVLTLAPELDYPQSVAAAIDGLLGRGGAEPAAGDPRTALFGSPRPLRRKRRGLVTFPDGGLSVWHGRPNARDARLLIDHGPLGYLSIAAHGHADALSVTLDLDGQPVLVDPGTYLYGSGGAWRRWFRSTAAHNTLNIAGKSQSIPSGPFNWSAKANARLEEAGSDPEPWVRLGHDGYLRRFGRRHQRLVSIGAGRIGITDQLLGGPPLPAEIVFQLAPDLDVALSGQSVTVARDADALLHIDFPTPDISVTTGGDRPGDGGWVSPRFGVKLPALRLAWRGQVGEGAVTTWLTPLRPRRPAPPTGLNGGT